MPFMHTCRDHPDWSGDVVEDVILHVGADHPGTTAGHALSDGGPISVRFVSQTVAQGNRPLRIFGCGCGRRVETRDRTVTMCPACAATAAGAA